ncbi:hypothetical protein DMN91_001638 [Ooceraea biroi]|uniref:Uncharacterized protein n=1 Tax=Ooceraea biroi TaxID=2015173 RepID=A0A3L8DYW6_OOCBI|nr:hypothetical protein DMN91_001638 [Ooceraea biroi]
MSRQAVLKLYKDILRYGETLRFTNKKYFQYRIRTAFKDNKDLMDEETIDFQLKSYKRYLDYSNVPTLEETDLEEQFVRGSGPGGQATNKTNNAVVLKHKPTGFVVKCHETRSMWDNKKRAREIMITKLDNLLNKENSIEAQIRALEKKRQASRDYKKKKLAEMKKAFREREGLT